MTMKQYTHLGFNNWLRTCEIEAIQVPNSKPASRSVQQAREADSLVDMTQGRRVKSIVMLKSGRMVISALSPDTIVSRIEGLNNKSDKDDKDNKTNKSDSLKKRLKGG